MNHPVGARPRKVSVEVYFVLYLSAIILLLGTTPSHNTNNDDELEETIVKLLPNDFKVFPERHALIFGFIPAGHNTLDTVDVPRDSINIVRAVGHVTDVRFSIVSIEDSSTGQTLPVESATLTRQGDRAAEFRFRWDPERVRRNAVYRVMVSATAVPLPPTTVAPEIRTRVADVLRRRGRVVDTTVFTVNVFDLSDPIVLTDLRIRPGQIAIDTAGAGVDTNVFITNPGQAATMPFRLVAALPQVSVAPGASWSNTLLVYGVNDARNEVEWQKLPGRMSIVADTTNVIRVTGVAPTGNSSQEIVIQGRRRSDARTIAASFLVKTSRLDEPRLPSSLFEDQQYALDFSSDGVESSAISVKVFENGTQVKDDAPARFNHRPASSGKLRFERYVGAQKIDVYEIDVRPIPLPTVEKPAIEDEELIIRTVSYGEVDGRKNLGRPIVNGCVSDPEDIPSRYRYNPETGAHVQTWRLKREKKGPCTFTVYVLDQRGSRNGKSREFTFNVQ